MLGHQPYLKIILNQENPATISRFLHYYEQLNLARVNIIRKIKALVAQIKTTAQQIQVQTKHLQLAKHKYQQHQFEFIREKHKRQNILISTNRELKNKNLQLKKLLADKTQLEKIITKLTASEHYNYAPGAKFAEMHGKLLWPIKSHHLLQTYGQKIANGRMTSTGILIQAKTGTKIHAIFAGKVIFAKWLHGFGLLTIIQHGSHFMTLYGRNQSLYVTLGETVHPGQIIATAGKSGGFQQTALYFEIRHDAHPLNPLAWLRTATKA